MKYGFVKCAAATPRVRVADCEYNLGSMLALIREADARGARLVVFPELCITGYTCGDLFGASTLLRAALDALRRLLEETAPLDMLVVAGLPFPKDGSLYNCAAVLHRGRLLGLVPKTNIPNYNEFYELRNFAPAPKETSTVRVLGEEVPFGTNLLFRCEKAPDFCLGVEICEDVWVASPPSVGLTSAGATIIANLSASNETVGKADYRRLLVQSESGRCVCGYVFADAGEGESTTDVVFSGHDMVAENGVLLAESELFTTGLTISEIDVEMLAGERRRLNTFSAAPEGYSTVWFDMEPAETSLTRTVEPMPFVPASGAERRGRCETILSIQSEGLRKRLKHTNARTAVVGVSGGLDSTLALIVAARAFDLLSRPRGDIIAITMPGFGTTGRTKSNATRLAELLGVTLREVDIAPAVRRHFLDIGQDEGTHDVTYENSQARERTQVLMDYANRTGGIVVGTGDLSELALGWATYNGDHMSMYGVNAGVPKTLIRHIIDYYADTCGSEDLALVLRDVLATPVSPELLPPEGGNISQKTEDLVGPYELHDFFLYHMVRRGFGPAKVLRLAEHAWRGTYSREVILAWLRVFCRRFFSQQFKRSCLPDGPKVGSVSLSPRGDWRMPSDASAALWLAELEEM